MKFTVSMKDPDTLGDAIDEAVKYDVLEVEGLADEEREVVEEERGRKVRELCNKWFKYSEYLTVEIDTEAGTCTVLPASA